MPHPASVQVQAVRDVSSSARTDSRQRAAGTLVVALCLALAIGLLPYATGLLGIPVLYVALQPVHDWLARHVPKRVAAALVVGLVILVLVVVGGFTAGLILREAQRIPGMLTDNPLVQRISTLTVGGIDIGARLAELSSRVVTWIGSNAFGFLGTASRAAVNLIIACIGLYYLLLRPGETWEAFSANIPFSASNTERLRQRFRDVTKSTLIGTGLSALVHGALVGFGFRLAGLPNATLWGAVAVVASLVPVVSTALVWGPGAVALLLDHRPGAAVFLALWGLLVVGNVGYVLQPMVSRRWGHIHPLVTLLGAVVGVPYLGLLGLLIGPLAVSYCFELIGMYREEYAPR
ncbi:MAG TPA: AI-2E family transporter [Gemmatimonadales bacterium]|nr:AI-2E family transporter [Gemmatimonadales bacterium]